MKWIEEFASRLPTNSANVSRTLECGFIVLSVCANIKNVTSCWIDHDAAITRSHIETLTRTTHLRNLTITRISNEIARLRLPLRGTFHSSSLFFLIRFFQTFRRFRSSIHFFFGTLFESINLFLFLFRCQCLE